VNFELTVLGSGAAIPTSKRNPTSQYLVCNDRHILIDCGEGTQMQIRKYGVRFQRINHILISHLHGDHYFGLVGLISTMRLMGRDKNLAIYGPKGLESIIRTQLEIGDARLEFEIEFVEIDGKSSGLLFEDNRIEIHYFPLKHRIPTNGFLIKEKPKERKLDSEMIKGSGLLYEHMHRLKAGEDIELEDGRIYKNVDYTLDPAQPKSYAYCSDTAYSESIIPYISGADLLYNEATFLESESSRAKATFHSTAKQAALIAQKASVKKLLLGHLSARYSNDLDHINEAADVFENVEMAEDGKLYQI
jgi:ribonuclease Z